jgi:arylsulfatase A-like enzyme
VSQPPNIILIITDQQRFDTIAALGASYARTPHLDRLAREGIAFTGCFVAGASCAPSRASLFSGCYPHTAGVMRNADPWRACWVEDLARAGYHCVNVGKMHTYPFEAPMGFHERYVVENKDRYLEGRYFFDRWDVAFQANGLDRPGRVQYRKLPDYAERLGAISWDLSGAPEHLHSDVYVGGLARWWVERKPRTQPLFLQVGFPGPHPPYDPPPAYVEPFRGAEFPLPAPTAAEIDALPAPLRAMRAHNTEVDHDSILWSLEPTKAQLQRLWAHYQGNVSLIDAQVGALLGALEEGGYLEDAVVVFTSDHGDCLGDHGQIQKWTMHDCITRVPFIVWSPNRFGGGRVEDGLWQQMDLAPALLELAGVPVPESWEAVSMLPALRGDAGPSGREHVFCEQAGDNILAGTELMTMVRSREWKLVHFLGIEEGELYHLPSDPGERTNLWSSGRTEHRTQKGRLLETVLEWRLRGGLRAPRRAQVLS